MCAANSTGTGKPAIVEVCVRELLSIDILKHAKLIDLDITLATTLTVADVCFRTIVPHQEQHIILN